MTETNNFSEIDPITLESTLRARRARARACLEKYTDVRQDVLDEEEALGDLLADMMHLCDGPESASDFDEALRRGRMHHEAEVSDHD